MDLKRNHTRQIDSDGMWRIKQDAFFRISEQVGNIHLDERIPEAMKNLSLYLEPSVGNVFYDTKFGGIYRASRYNMLIKEYMKLDSDNWVVFINMYNIPDVEDSSVTDLNIENPYAAIDKVAIGCVDGQVMLSVGGAKRVISLSTNFESKKFKVNINELREFMMDIDPSPGYTVDKFNEGVYLIDSPAPLFGKDAVYYRDSDYVGMWISFGTLLKFDLRNLNVFNIDGVDVGAIDINTQSNAIKTLKALTNTAYGYATIIFDKKELLQKIMQYSKKYIYETNMEDETRICVDNLLETLQEKGIFGLLYDEYEVVENFPLMAYDETSVSVTERLGTVMKFKYKNEYIYMALDAAEGKMYFLSYAGRISDYYNSKYQYNVKIMNDMWLTKVNDVTTDGFVLFTGFPNLQHNKVLDIYFDNTAESFSSLDKNFAIDVNEFDKTWNDAVFAGGVESYNRNTDLIHAYGNNPVPLVTGLVAYKFKERVKEVNYYELTTGAEPAISTIIDPESKKAFLMVPSLKTNGLYTKSISPIRTEAFLENYMARWLEDPLSVDQWLEEAEAGSYQYTVVLAYYSNGWTIYKDSQDSYSAAKLNPVRIEYIFSGAVEHLAMKKVDSLVEIAKKLIESGQSRGNVEQEIKKNIIREAEQINSQIQAQVTAMKSSFVQEIMRKNNQITAVIEPDSPKFKFERFVDSDNIFVNNKPTGEVNNQAFLFEDTFVNIYQAMQREYFKDMDIKALDAYAYCPYFRHVSIRRIGDATTIDVSADQSTAVVMKRSKKAGLSYVGDMLEANNKLKIGNTELSPDEAYQTSARIQYFGVKKIGGVFKNIFHLSSIKTMTDTAKDAYVAEFNRTKDKMSQQSGNDFDAMMAEAYEKNGIDGAAAVDIQVPSVPDSQPIYIAQSEGGLSVSLDGENFVDAPIGTDDFFLTARLFIDSKARFLSVLQAVVNADKNILDIDLHNDTVSTDRDLYSVSVKQAIINHRNVVERGEVDIELLLEVASGQIVLKDSPDIIYSAGDNFVVSQTVDIDGFLSVDDERIKILVNASLEYYSSIPQGELEFNTALELRSHPSAYLFKLGLPISLMINRGDWLFVDKDEAEERVGLTSWFNFTGGNE